MSVCDHVIVLISVLGQGKGLALYKARSSIMPNSMLCCVPMIMRKRAGGALLNNRTLDPEDSYASRR